MCRGDRLQRRHQVADQLRLLVCVHQAVQIARLTEVVAAAGLAARVVPAGITVQLQGWRAHAGVLHRTAEAVGLVVDRGRRRCHRTLACPSRW